LKNKHFIVIILLSGFILRGSGFVTGLGFDFSSTSASHVGLGSRSIQGWVGGIESLMLGEGEFDIEILLI
jgi:hypothetical protein